MNALIDESLADKPIKSISFSKELCAEFAEQCQSNDYGNFENFIYTFIARAGSVKKVGELFRYAWADIVEKLAVAYLAEKCIVSDSESPDEENAPTKGGLLA